jgi:protein O-mannosyl-transferase
MSQTRRIPDPIPPAENPSARRHDLLVCFLLLLAILAVFSQVRSFDFVNIDDPEYITTNARVRAGLSWEGLRWAFTSGYAGNWFPITWLSHMLDAQLFGMDAGLHHIVNVLLHSLSTILLFVMLKRMTKARWRSAFVAFLFGLHPLHVESVAWVTERKDVLSAFFWILTLWFYARYVEKPRFRRYVHVIASFSLGLLSKSMVVTLPFVLLLLDFWPLRRTAVSAQAVAAKAGQKPKPNRQERPKLTAVLIEKAPLLALSFAVSVITFVVQRRSGAVAPLDYVPLATRLGNGLLSYITYIGRMFWPTGLAVFYPLPTELPLWQVTAAFVLLALISYLVVRRIRTSPYLAVGWFWYLGTLVPVIGVIQVGMQAHADRYTYLPLIGLFLMLAWGLADLLRVWPPAKKTLAAVAVVFSSACLFLTWHQIQYWQDSRTLFEHALAVTIDNAVAHNGLGIALSEQGRFEDAISHFQEAIRIKPRYPEARSSLGAALLRLGRTDDAIRQLEDAIRISPGALEARINLGIAFQTQGKTDGAVEQLLKAIQIQPDSANAHYNLGRAYAGAGRIGEAAGEFLIASKLEPGNAEAHYNLGITLARGGDMGAATTEFTRALQINPDYGAAHNNLGSALASQGRLDDAILHFREAVRLMPDSEEARRNLEYALSFKK